MANYLAQIDSGLGGEQTIEADSADEALLEAVKWAMDAGWDLSDGTIWIDVRVENEGDSDDCASERSVAIHPEEPECSESEHDWRAPHELAGGVVGHAGGIIVDECCVHCGCKKTTDTWAQRADTGEQGLTSIRYEPGFYADAIANRDSH